jgi:hypothetical protein
MTYILVMIRNFFFHKVVIVPERTIWGWIFQTCRRRRCSRPTAPIQLSEVSGVDNEMVTFPVLLSSPPNRRPPQLSVNPAAGRSGRWRGGQWPVVRASRDPAVNQWASLCRRRRRAILGASRQFPQGHRRVWVVRPRAPPASAPRDKRGGP